MNHDNLIFLKELFDNYCKAFYSGNEADNRNIELKQRHSHNVCRNITQILTDSRIIEEELSSGIKFPNSGLIAETAALFHDIGRFRQYAEYKTFRDAVSVNHGLLGAKILRDNKILNEIPANEQEIIINTVKFHNAFRMPHLADRDSMFFLKLVRDADKLDIWQVFTEYDETPEAERASAVSLGLPDEPGYSEHILSCLYGKKMTSISNLRTSNDFRLMQLLWIYDLNFDASFSLLLERDYINKIAKPLPKDDRIIEAIAVAQEYSYQRSGMASHA